MHNSAHIQPAIAPPQPTASSGIHHISVGMSILVLPAIAIASVLLYKQYRVTWRRRQIERLEQMWKLNYQKKPI